MAKTFHNYATKLVGLLTFLFCVVHAAHSFAASAYNPNVNESVNAISVQGDGKSVIGGAFTLVGGTSRNRIARLNTDGSLDATFNPNANNSVNATVLQADGKILAGGAFTSIGVGTRNRIARLNADGSLDMTFNPNANNTVSSIALQGDGKIIIGGAFTAIGGLTCNRIARLNSDGTLDTSFDPNANNSISSIMVQTDGKIVIGGSFTTVGGVARNQVARLNSDGTLDSSFDPNANNSISSIVVQADGKIVIGGSFTTVGGVTRNRIARLNSDGSLDLSFNPNADNSVYSTTLQADGKILIGGAFANVGGASHKNISRLNSDGSVDSTFSIGTNGYVYALALQADGKAMVGGYFTYIGTAPRNNLARLNSDGSLDTNSEPNSTVYFSALQPDGKIVIGGDFTAVGGITHYYIARLNADWSVDSTFNPVATVSVKTGVVQADGKILIGGAFTYLNGATRNYIARLNADGSTDTSFNPNVNGNVYSITILANGKLVIGGDFTSVGGVACNRIARLNADGSVDSSFNPDANNTVFTSVVLPDGKIVFGGRFNTVGGVAINSIARLNADGSLDSSFNPNADGAVVTIAVQADGKLVIGGMFATVSGVTRNRIARLNADGSLDQSFNPNATSTVSTITLQTNGKIIASGGFTTIGGVARNYIARLNGNGSVDTTFNPNPNYIVYSTALQQDGTLVMGGGFTTVGGSSNYCLVRLPNNEIAEQSLDAGTDGASITWLRSGASPEVDQVSFDQSSDMVTWVPVGNGVRISSGWQLTGLSLPWGDSYIRARGVARCGNNNGSASLIESVKLIQLIPAPPVPVATAATDLTVSSFTAAWQASSGATGYFLDISSDSSFTSFVEGYNNLNVGNVTGYGIAGLSAGTTYYFRVRAYNGNGISSASSTSVSVTTLYPVSGVCGGSHTGTFTVAPVSNLCSPDVAVTVSPSASGWNWTCPGQNGGASVACYANIRTWNITAGSNGHGSISCNSQVNHGSSFMCSIFPEAGYTLTGLTDNGIDVLNSVAGGNSYTVNNVTASHALTATFADITAPVVVVSTLRDGSVTSTPVINVAGSVSDPSGVSAFSINGVPVVVHDKHFSQSLELVAGVNQIIIVASDTFNNSRTLSRTITYDSTAPAIAITTPPDNGTVNFTLHPLMTVTGTIDPLQVTAVDVSLNGEAPLPASLTDGAFSATVVLAEGVNTVEVIATSLTGISIAKRTVLAGAVLPAISVSSPDQDGATAAKLLSATVTLADTINPLDVHLSSDDGVTFTKINETPVTSGSFPIALNLIPNNNHLVVTATDPLLGEQNLATVQRNMIYKPPFPTITTTFLAEGTVNVQYNQTVAANGTEPYIWSVTSGSLPAGLNMSSTGVINGVPASAGTYNFVVQVNDANNMSATKELSIIINVASFNIIATAGANGSISGPASVNYGGSAAYTIIPATGYHVADVLVDGVSAGAVTSYTFSNVTANHTISASFAINSYSIAASAGANGSISGPVSVNYGGSAAYTITPATGYHVSDVLVDGVSAGAVTGYSFTNVTVEHTISASFAINIYSIATSAGANGSISGPAGVNYGGSAAYTITPVIGYHVVDVLVDGVSAGAVTSYTISNVTADHTITASFAINIYSIATSAGANGSISGPAGVNYGGSAAYTITPVIGYHVVDVLVDGVSAGAVTSYTISNVTADHTITASFAINSYSITATAGANGSISGPVSVNYGGSAAYTITPATGYHVSDVLVDGVSAGAVTSYTFTNVTVEHTISASFAINSYSITASAGANGSISGPAGVNYGGSAAYTITPATGYHVADVLVDGVSVGAVTSYTFTNVTANHTIAASFAINSYSIAASAGANGSISGPASVNYGASASYTITPIGGYGVAAVLVDGVSVGAVTSYTFSNVVANHTISVTFAALPDLISTGVTAPANATRGRNASVSATIKNQGGGNAGGFSVSFYFSTNNSIASSDTLLGISTVASLNAGGTTTVNGSFTVPSGMSTGKYYVGVIVDSGDAVIEASESNNSKAAATTTNIK